MTELTLRICHICFTESIPLSKVVFFQCGHNACQQCAEGTYGQIHQCAECRRQKGIPHRIYLNSDDLTTGTMGQVIEHAKRAGAANTGPNEPTENLDNNRGTDSDSTYERGIKHMFLGSVDVQKQIKDQLKELQTTHQNTVMALDGVIQEHKAVADRHRRRAQGYLTLLKEKDAEILKLQEQLKERDKNENLMKTKLKALSKLHKKGSATRSQDGDASLQIEDHREVTSELGLLNGESQGRQNLRKRRLSSGFDGSPPRGQQTKRQRAPASPNIRGG